MILDMSQFMRKESQGAVSFDDYLKDHYSVVYDFFMADPMNAPTYMVGAIRNKLMLINYLMDKNRYHQYFIENCFSGTITLACLMCQFEYGDYLYLSLRECFLRMDKDIRYLLSTIEPDIYKLQQNQQQFNDLINALKMVQAVRELRSYSINSIYQTMAAQLPPNYTIILKQSFLFNILYMINNKQKLKCKLQEINRISQANNIFFSIPEINGNINSIVAANLIQDVIYDAELTVNMKIKLYREIIQELKL